MSTNKICNDTLNNDGVCEINDMLQNMSTADVEETTVSVCANCGREGSDIDNVCNKCKSVKYCNAACKKKHRHKHKKECRKRAAKYSNNLRQQKIVQSVFYDCQHYIPEGFIWHVVERLFAVDVIMRLSMMTRAMKLIMKNKTSVHFAELHFINQMRR